MEVKYMKILAVDNEHLQLRLLCDAIHEAEPNAEVTAFSNSLKALEWAQKDPPSIAFLDINMPVLNGIQLAKELKRISPAVNLVFVTGFFEDYVLEALPLRFSGYLQKPVTAEAVATELNNLRFPVPAMSKSKRLTVRCFGTFEVFCDGKPVAFSRKKTKEFFAFLVDRRGSRLDMNTMCAALFEDASNDSNNKSILRKCIVDLRKSLEAIGAENVFLKNFNSYAIDPEAINCDYYDWEKNDPDAIRAFRGEYMSQYSWAETTLAGIMAPPEPGGRS